MTTTQDIVDALDKNEAVQESYVLVREIMLYLKTSGSNFSPKIRIKIYRSSVQNEPFHFSVSHQAHTPVQAAPYFPSVTSASTEEEAIQQAVHTTTSFLRSAIAQGHKPNDSWLVENENF